MLSGVAVHFRMVAVAGAAAVEALEADIQAGGIVLCLLVEAIVNPEKSVTDDGIEALGAVLAIYRICERRLRQVWWMLALATSKVGAREAGSDAYLLVRRVDTPCLQLNYLDRKKWRLDASLKTRDQIECSSARLLVSAGKLSCGCGGKLAGAETRGKRDRQQPRDSTMQRSRHCPEG
jgi:hypothetical protein